MQSHPFLTLSFPLNRSQNENNATIQMILAKKWCFITTLKWMFVSKVFALNRHNHCCLIDLLYVYYTCDLVEEISKRIYRNRCPKCRNCSELFLVVSMSVMATLLNSWLRTWCWYIVIRKPYQTIVLWNIVARRPDRVRQFAML